MYELYIKSIIYAIRAYRHNVIHSFIVFNDKKAQLSLTNPRDAKACQKLLQFDVLTTLSLTIGYWPIFIRLAVVASEICEIPRNSLKI